MKVKCEKCSGSGIDGKYICDNCGGYGEINWIQNIISKVDSLVMEDFIFFEEVQEFLNATFEKYNPLGRGESGELDLEIASFMDGIKMKYKISDFSYGTCYYKSDSLMDVFVAVIIRPYSSPIYLFSRQDGK